MFDLDGFFLEWVLFFWWIFFDFIGGVDVIYYEKIGGIFGGFGINFGLIGGLNMLL